MTNVLIGCTGSVAAIKLPLLVFSLMDKLGLKAENVRSIPNQKTSTAIIRMLNGQNLGKDMKADSQE